MRYSLVFLSLAGIHLSAAYLDDKLQYVSRDVDLDSYIGIRDLDGIATNLIPRGNAPGNVGSPLERPAGGFGIGHSRLPIAPPRHPRGQPGLQPSPPPAPSPGVKIVKTKPLGPAKERVGWPLPSIRDFQREKAQPPRDGKATFNGGPGKAEFAKQTPETNPAIPPLSRIKPTKDEHLRYLTRPKIVRPGTSISNEGPGDNTP